MPKLGAVFGAASPGLGRAGQAFFGKQQGYDAAYDNELKLQSHLAQQLAQTQAANARAGQDQAETRVIQGRPDLIDETVALETGSTLPMVRAVQEYVRTGQRPMRDMAGPPTEAGIGPEQAPVVDDGLQSLIAKALARQLPQRMNVKDTKADDYAKANQMYRENDLGDDVLAGRRTPGAVGASQAAVGGKALFNSDANGAVLDNFGGGYNTDNPMAQSTIGLKGAQARQADAGARENDAQAARAFKEGNASVSKPFEVTGQDGNPVLVQQTKDGKIVPVRDYSPKGGTAKPLPPGVLKQITEARDNAATINRLANGFKPEYAGKGVMGFGADAQMLVSGNTGIDKDAVEFWKNYRKESELVERHAMFGASLTPGEQNSWRSADVAPGMHPDVVRRNLQTRATLAKKMFENTRQDLVDAGHSEKRIGSIAERNMDVPQSPGANTGFKYLGKE